MSFFKKRICDKNVNRDDEPLIAYKNRDHEPLIAYKNRDHEPLIAYKNFPT